LLILQGQPVLCRCFLVLRLIRMAGQTIRDFSSPQCQPNQTYCTAGESLLTWCAGLWAVV
jgi:hypothetical protein